jgi:hypothetical protein
VALQQQQQQAQFPQSQMEGLPPPQPNQIPPSQAAQGQPPAPQAPPPVGPQGQPPIGPQGPQAQLLTEQPNTTKLTASNRGYMLFNREKIRSLLDKLDKSQIWSLIGPVINAFVGGGVLLTDPTFQYVCETYLDVLDCINYDSRQTDSTKKLFDETYRLTQYLTTTQEPADPNEQVNITWALMYGDPNTPVDKRAESIAQTVTKSFGKLIPFSQYKGSMVKGAVTDKIKPWPSTFVFRNIDTNIDLHTTWNTLAEICSDFQNLYLIRKSDLNRSETRSKLMTYGVDFCLRMLEKVSVELQFFENPLEKFLDVLHQLNFYSDPEDTRETLRFLCKI